MINETMKSVAFMPQRTASHAKPMRAAKSLESSIAIPGRGRDQNGRMIFLGDSNSIRPVLMLRRITCETSEGNINLINLINRSETFKLM